MCRLLPIFLSNYHFLTVAVVPKKIPKPGEFGRVMAQEIMVVTPAISNLIREGKTSQIYSAIQTGGKLGMQTLEKVLAELYRKGDISFEAAMSKTSKPDEIQRIIGASTQQAGGVKFGMKKR